MRPVYSVNEIFAAPQGEGMRAGTANVFVRFSGCNLRCDGAEENDQFAPVCDTEFTSGTMLTVDEMLLRSVEALAAYGYHVKPRSEQGLLEKREVGVIFTGGEPSLQLTEELVRSFSMAGFLTAIETNGTRPVPVNLDYIAVSPKTAEHTLHVSEALTDAFGVPRLIDELRYVRRVGQAIPKPALKALYYLISPHVQPTGVIHPEDMEWCVKLVMANPTWRLSTQQHKTWGVR